MRPRVVAYCLDWHVTYSAAFRELLVAPLAEHADIELIGWDGETVPETPGSSDDLPTIFCQLAPPTDYFDRIEPRRVVWIPMWDNIRERGRRWWRALPRELRIVGFSRAVVACAERAGLPVLPLTYSIDPGDYPNSTWSQGPMLFYWNRVGLVDPEFLQRLCSAITARTLFFRPDLDPRIDPSRRYELPERLGNTRVEVVSPADRRAHLAYLRSANVFLSPRPYEGVGLATLEALASGCAVLAHDGAAMNEYIEHGESGFLLRGSRARSTRRFPGPRRSRTIGDAPLTLSLDQDWDALARIDLQLLGAQAKRTQAEGFSRWRAAWPDYARFVLD